MNRVSAEDDIRFALRKYYAERVVYPLMGGYQDGTISLSGDVEGIPYGDIYEVGDIFTEAVGDGLLGKIYYVAHAEPGNPTLELQQEVSRGQARPKVVLVNEAVGPEVVQGASRVYIGIRSRPTARSGFVRALHASRRVHQDGKHIVLTEPFWRGGFYYHVEGANRSEAAYVTEMVNTRVKVITDLYKFEVDVMPIRLDVVNLEVGGVFRNVINLNATARVTPATPLDQLPDGMPQVYFPYDPITGVSPVIEHDSRGASFPWPAEKVGDYPLSEEADPYADMPRTE